MTGEAQIRAAEKADINSISRLAVQLGYQPSLADVDQGLEVMANHPDYEAVVIIVANRVLGWMTLNVRYRLEASPFLQVIGIVVDSEARGQGLGKKLLAYAESQAKEKGLTLVALYSNKRRIDAHQFYERAGYDGAKESRFFTKHL